MRDAIAKAGVAPKNATSKPISKVGKGAKGFSAGPTKGKAMRNAKGGGKG